MRHVEGYRQDLRLVDTLLMRRFWYSRHLEQSMSEIISQSREEFDRFKQQATRFDLGLPFDRDRIQQLYETVMLRWVDIGTQGGGAFFDWSCRRSKQELTWLRSRPSTPQGMLVRFSPSATTLDPEPIAQKDAENLRYVRSKLTEGALRGDPSDLLPRHHSYWRVWTNYQQAVEASLVVAASRGGPALMNDLAAEYAAWYPEADRAAEAARSRLRSLAK
jgi:hypothetical protein